MGRKISGRRGKIWHNEGWQAALAGAAMVAISALGGMLAWLEYGLYDAANHVTAPAPLSEIVIVEVDDASLSTLGTAAGSREVYARLIDRLAAAGAKTIVLLPPFFESQPDPGLAYIQKMQDVIARAADPSPLAAELTRTAEEARKALDTDARLAASLERAGNVFLASRYALAGGSPTPLPAYARRSVVSDPGVFATPATSAQHPIATLGAAAAGVGHWSSVQDSDQHVRRIPLLLRYDNVGIPSLALLAARHSLHLSPDDRHADTGARGLRISGLPIATDAAARVRPRFHASADGASPFPTLPLSKVLDGTAVRQGLQDKVVLVGETSPALSSPWAVPGVRPMYPVEVLAHTVSSLRQGLAVRQPTWASAASWSVVLGVLLWVALLLPRLSRPAGWTLGTALALTLVCVEWGMLRYAGQWVVLTPAALAVLAGLTAWSALRAWGKQAPQAATPETAEADRMMGLALQGQGQLDMAFERLRKVPPSDALMDNLYHLAQDFERKRNFARAKSVYKHILQHDRGFRDAHARYKRARAHLQKDGAPPSSTPASLPPASVPHLPGDATAGIPRLGRYHVEKEIGKGAMGVVYLGRDPKIGRVVAIKTLALGEEFEGSALVDARARFFREAETAGRLQHPYIVTIFDAGEEHDLAYIAMEFLRGTDLTPVCHAGQLLPVPTVLSIVGRVAQALDYAHAHNVVHRDIKPANIMFDPATDAVKVTDFGIARITDSSKTRTGLVLGTPSFMSPEQLAGKKVDGRSDLYSLGVTLFQLLTGSLPLRGESMTELMHKIANVEAPDIRELRPELSPAVARIVALALQKRPESRYQTGQQFASDLQQAGASGGPTPPPKAEAVVYDARRDATGHEMADYQRTVTTIDPADPAASSLPISGTR